jgi:trimethylamine--corrinoid protein Co-methyltransferase
MLESHAMLLLDDELCGAAARMARGIEVNDESMALDMIKKVGFSGNYITERHTSKNFRSELFMPKLFSREPYEAWEKGGSKLALDNAREHARELLSKHQPYPIDPAIESELDAFRQMVNTRSLDEFYLHETEAKQDLGNL